MRKSSLLLSVLFFSLGFLFSCGESDPVISQTMSNLNSDFNQSVKYLSHNADNGTVYVNLITDASLDFDTHEQYAKAVAMEAHEQLKDQKSYTTIEVVVEDAEMTTGTSNMGSALSETYTFSVSELE